MGDPMNYFEKFSVDSMVIPDEPKNFRHLKVMGFTGLYEIEDSPFTRRTDYHAASHNTRYCLCPMDIVSIIYDMVLVFLMLILFLGMLFWRNVCWARRLWSHTS